MILEIPLPGGLRALVSAEDFTRLSAFRWSNAGSRGCYAARWDGRLKKVIYMHREILGAPDGVQVDHVNGDRLDNRRENLRLAPYLGFQRANRRLRKSASGFRGVILHKKNRNWTAEVKFRGQRLRVNGIVTAEEAARVYDSIASTLFGDFATLNFPKGAS